MSKKRTVDNKNLAKKEVGNHCPIPKARKTLELEKEIGGYEDQGLLEPTRYNDWDVKGRCSDF